MSEPSPFHAAQDKPALPLSLSVAFSPSEWHAFLRDCIKAGASDVTIQSSDYVWGDIKKRQTKVTARKLEHTEVQRALREMYGPTGPSQIAAGEALDFEFEITETDGDFDRVSRFRCNATGCRVGGLADGLSITMRTIPGLPLPWEKMKSPQDITDNFFPQYGLVLVIGTTGSGKSTLLSSGNRRRLENAERPVKIITFEDPIESVYTGLAADRMPQPSQVQIKKHLKSFDEAGRNAMRRKADVIIMGESRDRESVSACFEMALSGHAVYSTLHADTPAEAFARMVSFYPEDSQPAAANKLLSTLVMIVAQKLETCTDGSVAAVRSWLVVDREVKRRLGEAAFHTWGHLVDEILAERGTLFEQQTVAFMKEGRMDFRAFQNITKMTINESVRYLTQNQLVELIPEQYRDRIA